MEADCGAHFLGRATAGGGFVADALWSARFLTQLPGHWLGRAARRGTV
ncbi:hypothetical protein [Neoroseomonas lacus]|nr:hypothetical protein [Neoroseomonas lacus]